MLFNKSDSLFYQLTVHPIDLHGATLTTSAFVVTQIMETITDEPLAASKPEVAPGAYWISLFFEFKDS